MRERPVLMPREEATMIEECAYGELALKIAVEVLEAGDIRRLSGKVDLPAFGAAIKAAAARLAAKHNDPDYENERVINMAHGSLLQPQNTVNDLDLEIESKTRAVKTSQWWTESTMDLCDEIQTKILAAETLQEYADKRHKAWEEDGAAA